MEDRPGFPLISDKELLQKDTGFIHHINPFVYSGYRTPTNDNMKTAKTILYLHNESVNIWSHLGGFIIFIGLIIYWTIYKSRLSSWMKNIANYVYLFCILILMFVSTLYHVSIGHSAPIANECQCFDWSGVSLVCMGSGIYTAFHELYEKGYKDVYIIFFILSIAFAGYFILTIKESLLECHQETNTDKVVCEVKNSSDLYLRTFLICIFSLSTILAWLIHYLLDRKFTDDKKRSLILILFTYLGYATVVFKLTCIPERFCEKFFDIFGYSHQIFHFGVLTGALLLWYTYQT
jgi:adiponectin receptor